MSLVEFMIYSLPKNVESVLIGEGILEEITGTLVLPTGQVLVTDERVGILLFNLEGDVLAKVVFFMVL